MSRISAHRLRAAALAAVAGLGLVLAPAATPAGAAPALDRELMISSAGTIARAPAGLSASHVSPPVKGTGVLKNRQTLERGQPAGGVGTNSIIPPYDDRYRITPTTSDNYPASAVVQIQLPSSEDLRCTGFMIGPNTVATAGHCVYEEFGGWKTGMVLYPGNDGISQPFGYCFAAELWSVVGWVEDEDSDYDYGAITLSCPGVPPGDIGYATGWFGYGWTIESLLFYGESIQGYPRDKPLTQWGSTDYIVAESQFDLDYQNDTTEGDSGAPVITELYGCYPCVIGIHRNGQDIPDNFNNQATRIREEVFNNFLYWASL